MGRYNDGVRKSRKVEKEMEMIVGSMMMKEGEMKEKDRRTGEEGWELKKDKRMARSTGKGS